MIGEFALNMNYGPEPDTISYLLKQGATIAEVQVRMDERQAGESYLNLSRSVMYMMRMLLSILLIQNFRKRREVKWNDTCFSSDSDRGVTAYHILDPEENPPVKASDWVCHILAGFRGNPGGVQPVSGADRAVYQNDGYAASREFHFPVL